MSVHFAVSPKMFTILHLSIFVVVAAANRGPNRRFEEYRPSQLSGYSPQLNDEVFPSAYNLTFIFGENFAQMKSFNGSAIINITVDEISNGSSTFQLHAKGLHLGSVVLKDTEGTLIATIVSGPDPFSDFVTIVPVQKKLDHGFYSLKIDFTGYFEEEDTVGLYKTSYVDEYGETHFLVGSQFADKYARKAFPCFDEPEMKATFEITVIYPKGYHVKSNTEGGTPVAADNPNLEKVTFPKTPLTSTHLVGIFISEFNCKNRNSFHPNLKVELCSQISAKDPSAQMALDMVPRILERMVFHTNHTYNNRKITLLAIPDFAAGTMENRGLISFREPFLLWHKYESSTQDKQQSLKMIIRAVAHQWFGSLVTLDWWNELFLNEGFSTFFSYYVADDLDPKGEHVKRFVVEEVQQALYEDSLGNSLPLILNITDPNYRNKSNDVSSSKGASVIRMIQHFLGFTIFKQNIVSYINRHQIFTANSVRLLQAFQAASPEQNMTKLMDSWMNKPGYPLISVNVSGNDLILSQKEFSLSEGNKSTQWYVPLTYSTSKGDFKYTLPIEWLVPGEDLIMSGLFANKSWVVFNNQQCGFYRVDYDDTLLSKISVALHADINTIPELSRSTIIDDQFNLAKAGRKSFSQVLNFITFLKNDDSYYSWYAAFNGFSYLLQNTLNEGIRKQIFTYIRQHIKTLNESAISLAVPTGGIAALKQAMLLKWQCRLNEEHCISDAVKIFKSFKECSKIRPPPDLKPIVYCYGLRNGTNSSEDFNFLWNQYLHTRISTEKVTILEALGCTSDHHIRETFLKNLFIQDVIRIQDIPHVFASVYYEAPDVVNSTIHVLTDNYKAILKKMNYTNFNRIIATVATRINTQTHIDTLTQFSKVKGLNSAVVDAVNDAIETGVRKLKLINWVESHFVERKSTAWAVKFDDELWGTLELILWGSMIRFLI